VSLSRLTVGHHRLLTVGHQQLLTVGHHQLLTVGHHQLLTVGHHQLLTVGHHQLLTVGHHQLLTVGHHQLLTVGHHQLLTVGHHQLLYSEGVNYVSTAPPPPAPSCRLSAGGRGRACQEPITVLLTRIRPMAAVVLFFLLSKKFSCTIVLVKFGCTLTSITV
jgi:hypothetical protein